MSVIINKLQSIANFELVDDTFLSSAGAGLEYKYYPDYMNNHYTLVVFSNILRSGVRPDDYTYTDYRLYIHNPEGKYVDSLFQMSVPSDAPEMQTNRILSKIEKIFTIEIRDKKINDLDIISS